MECNNPWVFIKQALLAGSNDPDIVHVQHEYGMYGLFAGLTWPFFLILYLLARLRGIPVVVTIHEGLNANHLSEPARELKGLYLRMLNLLIVSGASHVIFLSNRTADEFIESVRPGSFTVLPHGASEERPVEISKNEAKSRLGYAPEQTVITQPGYIEPRKGNYHMADLATRFDDHEFLLAGGPSKEAYEEYYNKILDNAPDNLTVSGFLEEDEFHAAFVASDLIVLPYQQAEQGGITNTVGQSGIFNWCATYGKPVVAADLPYFRSLEQEWECLEICDFDRIDDAERTVQTLLRDDQQREKLSRNIREYAEACSYANVAESHQHIYERVRAEGSTRGAPVSGEVIKRKD
jgi:glycosyltransferase involved in cell wall biosynthesis